MTTSSDEPRDSGPELWGGAECTIVRVGEAWRDQSVETGHRFRRDDIDRIAELGIKRVRFPILWESVAPDSPDSLDFTWADDRLAMLRERGIAVIGGLLHHGSGPHYTDLLDPDFPKKLGAYAARVAERYPWIDHWTPVNEPLTTARFACLYGHWYPHLGTLRHPDRDHRGPSRLHPRRAVALVRRGLGDGQGPSRRRHGPRRRHALVAVRQCRLALARYPP